MAVCNSGCWKKIPYVVLDSKEEGRDTGKEDVIAFLTLWDKRNHIIITMKIRSDHSSIQRKWTTEIQIFSGKMLNSYIWILCANNWFNSHNKNMLNTNPGYVLLPEYKNTHVPTLQSSTSPALRKILTENVYETAFNSIHWKTHTMPVRTSQSFCVLCSGSVCKSVTDSQAMLASALQLIRASTYCTRETTEKTNRR